MDLDGATLVRLDFGGRWSHLIKDFFTFIVPQILTLAPVSARTRSSVLLTTTWTEKWCHLDMLDQSFGFGACLEEIATNRFYERLPILVTVNWTVIILSVFLTSGL